MTYESLTQEDVLWILLSAIRQEKWGLVGGRRDLIQTSTKPSWTLPGALDAKRICSDVLKRHGWTDEMMHKMPIVKHLTPVQKELRKQNILKMAEEIWLELQNS